MQITFLGTAASEGYPNAFCACANCRHARLLGGPSLRKRSSLLINTDLLIDLGPDLMAACLQHSCTLADVRYCLQTHAHEDHLDPSHFISRSAECGVNQAPRLHFYAGAASIRRVKLNVEPQIAPDTLPFAGACERLNVELHPVEPLQSFALNGYQVAAMPAAHDPESTPLLYAIREGNAAVFYGSDTGPLPEEVWPALRAGNWQFQVVILDHTFGMAGRARGHMNHEQFLEQATRMRAEGLLARDARIFAHHLAHHSNPVHPELVARAAEGGYEVAHDGLTLRA